MGCVFVCVVHVVKEKSRHSKCSNMSVGCRCSHMSIPNNKREQNWSHDERLLCRRTIAAPSAGTLWDRWHACYFLTACGDFGETVKTHARLASSGWEAVNLSRVKDLNVWGARREAHAVWIAVQIPAESQINSDGKMRCHKEFIIPPLK